MKKEELKDLVETAAGRQKADIVIKNCRIINVFSGEIEEGDIAIRDGWIAGVGKLNYHGETEVDAEDRFAAPGFIDAHIHIESSYVSPEEAGRLMVPHGTSTIIADPHEIANVCGETGLTYMRKAAEHTCLDVIYALPSCVPSTSFEHAGAVLDAGDVEKLLDTGSFYGLGELMNAQGLINGDETVLSKVLAAKNRNLLVDGHAPLVMGKDLNAYACARIVADHECASLEDMWEKIQRGMYVMLREGSACHDMRSLRKGVTEKNSRRILLCSDDRQCETLLEKGHMDFHLRYLVKSGLDPVTVIRMCTLNPSEAFRLYDRGAIAPGYRADVVLLEDLKEFKVEKVWIQGRLAAERGKYLLPVDLEDISPVRGSVRVKGFSKERLKLHLKSAKVNVIGIRPDGVVTDRFVREVKLDPDGDFIFDPVRDICKLAVIERHQETGNMAVALLEGYGLKRGAVAVTVAHDSHNIIVAGASNEDMAFAVEKLIEQEGGMIVVNEGKVLASMPLPIAGLMSDQSGEVVAAKLKEIHDTARDALEIYQNVDPVMTLTFMSLPVIPEIKLTDMGLFDYKSFGFIPLEAYSS